MTATTNLYEVEGYGNTFLVKATSEAIAENKVHAWGSAEGFLRADLLIKTAVLGTK